MTTYEYPALDPDRRHIRRLNLLPGSFDDEIYITISEAELLMDGRSSRDEGDKYDTDRHQFAGEYEYWDSDDEREIHQVSDDDEIGRSGRQIKAELGADGHESFYSNKSFESN